MSQPPDPTPPDARRRCRRCGAFLAEDAPASACWTCMLAAGTPPLASSRPAPPVFSSAVGAAFEPSQRFGDYLLEEEIAHGGMGVVYRARQLRLGRTVAVKLLLLGRYSSAESVERFQREAQSAAALRHPNIVAIHEVGECDGQHYFSMEFVEGEDLAEILSRGPLPARRAAEIARTIADAIHYAHGQGVLHRDLKPSNVLIDALGQVHITDFGLAKKLDGSSDLTVTGQMVGSPNYLSPEAAAGRQDQVGPASDVYAMGALLYELLTGRPPFLAQSLQETLLHIRESEPVALRQLNPGIPRDLETICLHCLEKDPRHRFATSSQLAEDLARFLEHRPILTRPSSGLERLAKWMRRQPKLAAMLLITLCAALAASLIVTVSYLRVRAAQRIGAAKAEESRQRLVRLNVAAGNRLVDNHDGLAALPWFVQALQLDSDADSDDVGETNRPSATVHRRRLNAVMRSAPRLAQLWRHDAFVNTANFSPDGTRTVSASADKTARIWDTRTGRPLAAPLQHTSDVRHARFTPSGDRVLTVAGKQLQFWNVDRGEPLAAAIGVNDNTGVTVDFSPDGREFVAAVPGGVRFFNAATLAPDGPVLRQINAVGTLQFSPDGRQVATLGNSTRVRFWNVASREREPMELAHPRVVWLLQFSPDGRYLATATAEYKVHVWNLATGEPAFAPLPHDSILNSLQFSPDSQRLATGEWKNTAQVWDVATGLKRGAPLVHRGGVWHARFSPDGRGLAVVSTEVCVWDPETSQRMAPLLRHGGTATDAKWSSDSSRVLTCSQDGTVRLWQMPARSLARLTLAHTGAIASALFSPDGRHLLTCGREGLVKIWARASGEPVATFPHASGVTLARFSPDGRRVLTVWREQAQVWSIEEESKALFSLRHAREIYHAEFSPDGRSILTASADRTARVWDAATGVAVTSSLRHDAAVTHAAFRPDSARVITASADHTVQRWDARTGARLGDPCKHPSEVSSAHFSPDGRRIVTACRDRTRLPCGVYVWDAETGQRVIPPLMHGDGVFYAEFSPDGRSIASASEDESARLWDAATGDPLTPPLIHRSYVFINTFSPDGSLILTVSSDRTARVWDAATGEPVTPPLPHDAAVTSGAWSRDGREVITASDDGCARVWDVSPSRSGQAELQRQAELLSSHRLHRNTGLTPLSSAETGTRWQLRESVPPREADTGPAFSR